MSFWSDDRAAAIQVGVVVLLAFVVIAIAAYQATVVPNQNKAVEFNHNQQVQSQLQELQGAVGSAPTAGGTKTVVVDLSTTYPARSIFINPPNPTGTLRTVGTGEPAVSFTVQNASATGETGDFWNGSTRNYTTGAVAYRPNYNVYSQAPVSFVENSLVANQFADETLVRNAQSLFDGTRITLVAVNGSYRESGGSASVAVRPVSASTNTVSVTGTAGDPVTITIASRLSAAKWKAVLNETGDFDPDGSDGNAYVSDVEKRGEVTLPNGDSANRIAFVLETGETYSLQLAKVGIGTNVAVPDGGTYVTRASPRNTSTAAGSTQTVTVEVRDEYNNPQSGVPMNATVESGSGTIKEGDEIETDEDGRVTFTYEAPSSPTTARINVSISKRNSKRTSAVFNVSVTQSSGGGGTGNGAYNVTLLKPSDTTSNGVTCSANWPDNRTCIVNGSETNTVTVTMGTNPTADGATVDWAVNDTSVATVSPTEGVTDSNGQNSTTVTLQTEGEVIVYTSSGAGGNRTTLRVTNLGDATPPKLDSITVSSTEQGNSGKFDTINWDWAASDTGGSGFASINLRAEWADDGSTIDDYTSLQASGTYSYTFNNSKKNTPIDLIVTLTDNAGNTRTCTAQLSGPGDSVTLGDFTCSPTQSILPIPQTERTLKDEQVVPSSVTERHRFRTIALFSEGA